MAQKYPLNELPTPIVSLISEVFGDQPVQETILPADREALARALRNFGGFDDADDGDECD